MKKLIARAAIRKIARQHGISTAQCHAEIAAVIAEIWKSSDPQPTPEEFILLISQKVLDFR